MNILEEYKVIDDKMFKCVVYRLSKSDNYLVRITESKLNLANSYYFKDNKCNSKKDYDYNNKFYLTSYKEDLGRVLYDGVEINSIFMYYSPYMTNSETENNANEVVIPKDLDILLRNDKELDLFLSSINYILEKINESNKHPFDRFIDTLRDKYPKFKINDLYTDNNVRLNLYFNNGVCGNVFEINDYMDKQYSSISIYCYYEDMNDLLVDIIDGFKKFKLTGNWI